MSHASNGERKSGGNSAFNRFFHSEVSGSIVLLLCTVIALVWANSPWAEAYFDLAHKKIGIAWGDAKFALSLQHWVNDGLMVIFFFVVGLEIKREIVVGQLSSMKKAILPVAAAAGGMIVPAILYAALNTGGPGASGWGVPMATDIAFALGVLALLGKRVPIGLKVFLTACAIADDLGAVLVIALFYTETIRWSALVVAAIFLFLLLLARRLRVRRVGVHLLLIIGVWLAVFASGVHATVAGILVAMVIPVDAQIDPRSFLRRAEDRLKQLRGTELTTQSMIVNRAQLEAIHDIHEATGDMRPPGLSLEHHLHPIQAFLILPLFALFHAGVALDGRILDTLANPVSVGIVLGLILGKQVGLTLASWLVIRFGYSDMPEGVNWGQIYGVSCLAGIGFTMSLFVSELAFTDPELVSEAKIGILVASAIAGVFGYIVLQRFLPKSVG